MGPPDHPLARLKPEVAEAERERPPRTGGSATGKKRSPPSADTQQAAVAGGQPAAWAARVVHSESQFAALEPRWTALLAEAADANVFLSHQWLHSWWSAYRPSAELAIVVVEQGDRLRGIAPMMIETVRRAGIAVRTLRFIGDGTDETDHMNFLAARDERGTVMARLLDAIDDLKWDLAVFNQVPQASANSTDLLRWIDRNALHCSVAVSSCPVRRVPPSYEELLAALPGRLRTSIRSSRRKLQEKHRVEFGEHAEPSALDDALAVFFANHASRWQAKGQTGAFSDARKRKFYALLTPRLLEQGWLRFFHLSLDGRPVAQQYCFALDGTVMLLQEGFDYGYAQDNVGNVLRACVFEHLIESGAECYDFLAGSSRHKQSWSDGAVDDLRIDCARRSWRGWLAWSLPRWRERVKDSLRPWRDRLLAGRARG